MWSLTVTLLPAFLSFVVSQPPKAGDGPIVPFSTLPACASNCGPLYDVQGACSPPLFAAVNSTCFCTDPRLRPFDDAGTSGVSQVCVSVGACTAASDLQAIKSWYDSYCTTATTTLTTTSSGSTTSITSSPKPSASTSSLSLSTCPSSVSSSQSATPVVVSGGTLGADVKDGIGIGGTIGAFVLLLFG